MVVFDNAAYATRHCCKIGASVVLNTSLDFAGFLTELTGAGALKRRINFKHHERREHFVGLQDLNEQLLGHRLFGPPIYLPFQGATPSREIVYPPSPANSTMQSASLYSLHIVGSSQLLPRNITPTLYSSCTQTYGLRSFTCCSSHI